MMVRIQVECEIDDKDVPRLQEYAAEQRVMMVDPGGDEKSFVGRFAGAVQAYGVSAV
jgi:hypothetical protein